MPLFSNRPGMERMMQQKPAGGKEPETRLSRRSIPRHGCGYGRQRPCIGICYKDSWNSTLEETGMKLIVTEKPSVAQSIASVLGAAAGGRTAIWRAAAIS